MIEIRDLPAESAAKWNERAADYTSRMTKLQQEIEWAEKSADQDNIVKPKSELWKGARVGPRHSWYKLLKHPSLLAIEHMTAKEVTTQALQVQEESLAATSRTKAVVEQTIQVRTQQHAQEGILDAVAHIQDLHRWEALSMKS